MPTVKVLITDPVAEVCPRILKEHGLDVEQVSTLTPEQLCEAIAPCHALIVRSGTKVTAQVIAHAEHLRVIGRAGAGVDNIDVKAATERRIAVLNAAHGNTISTAEHTLALMFALARRIPEAHISLLNGRWERSRFKGVELSGKTLGVVGLGRIGREVAKRARALGMKILAYDPFLEASTFEAEGVEASELSDLFRRSDFVTIHVPYGPQTRHLVGEAQFEVCEKPLRLVNAARGGVVDEAALYRALKSGKVAGAALDVFEEEPPRDNPLFELENVVVTPHLGASTREAQIRVAEEIAKLVVAFLLHNKAENVVNPEVLQSSTNA